MMMKAVVLLNIVLSSSAAFLPSTTRRGGTASPFVLKNYQFGGFRERGDVVALHMANGKIGIFFGTSTGNTQDTAELIADEFGADADGPFEIDELQGSVASKFAEYDALIVGTPTWNTGADTERSGTGWDEIYYGEMQDLKIAGKNVGVFGLGDSVSYAENYADASGELHDVFENLGCKMMGYTSQEGYEHEASKAIRGDKFCGLLIDAVNQEDLTEGRVKNWVAQLKAEGILESGGGGEVATVIEVPAATVIEPDPIVEDAVPATGSAQVIAELERENAKLREKLEENSRLLDESISAHGRSDSTGYVPHYNPKKGTTMWTSPDGRSCYYTFDAPTKMSVSFSP